MHTKRKAGISRQAVMLGVRFFLLVLAVGVNIYAYVERVKIGQPERIGVFVLSLLSFPLFHLLLAVWWEPMHIRRIVRKAGENLVIAPHYAWNFHRESRSDWINIPGTLALTDRNLRFISSPLHTNDDLDQAIPLSQIVHVSGSLPERKSGHYLVVKLSDGAKMKIKLLSAQKQARWLRELAEKSSVTT